MRILLAVLLALPALASAQAPAARDLGTLLGAGLRWMPEYDGSGKQEIAPIPVIRYYDKILFARTTQGILEGGVRGEALPGFHVGAQLAFEEGNDRTDLDPGASLGLHFEWDTAIGPAPFNLLARGRQHLDSERGWQGDLRATVGVYGDRQLLLGVFAQATWASDEWVRSYYTRGEGGLLYAALGLEGAYEISRHWVALFSVHLRRLQGDAASSPITEEKSNYYGSAGVAYRF
jgi:outer membrane scaffolding protein for murein synthesis (MipA/OmpV family)